MRIRRLRSLVLILSLGLLCVVSAGCLGQDYKSVSLDLTDQDHGWLAKVEPDEDFGVVLRDNPQYPGAEWSMIDIDPTVISFVDSFVELPTEGPTDPWVLMIWVSRFKGLAVGESPLRFELVSNGETVDIAEFTVAVVEDACEGKEGVAAPRCRHEHPGRWLEGFEWMHGEVLEVGIGEELSITLTPNALHPDAPWQVAEDDPPLLKLDSAQQIGTRTPGNWDTDDDSESGSFLPTSEFVFTAESPGETQLTFEILHQGKLIEFCEFRIEVRE
jgi:hypothetical protein